jgi:transcription elongation factor GreB
MNQLLAERQMLLSEKDDLNNSRENEKRIESNLINAKLQLLDRRIAEARIVNPKEQPQNEIRFGAVITLKIEVSKIIQTFQIVGVDEADISKGKIAFTSPLAKALMNRKIGDKVAFKRTSQDIVFQIIEISYI